MRKDGKTSWVLGGQEIGAGLWDCKLAQIIFLAKFVLLHLVFLSAAFCVPAEKHRVRCSGAKMRPPAAAQT